MGQASGRIRQRCAAILVHEERLLVMRQNNRAFWVLPGGTLEPGETLATCLQRELCEEVDLLIEVGPLVGVSDFIDSATDRHVIDFFFIAHYLDGPLTWQAPYPENINEIKWITRDELDTLDLKPPLAKKQILNGWTGRQPWPVPSLPLYWR